MNGEVADPTGRSCFCIPGAHAIAATIAENKGMHLVRILGRA